MELPKSSRRASCANGWLLTIKKNTNIRAYPQYFTHELFYRARSFEKNYEYVSYREETLIIFGLIYQDILPLHLKCMREKKMLK